MSLLYGMMERACARDGLRTMSPDVSIVIPAYNMDFCIAEVLAALHAQAFPAERLEIILVDDGSTDRTRAVAEETRNRLGMRHLQIVHQANAGPAAARNHGIQLARAPVVAFIDSDCIADPGWIENLTEPLRQDPLLAGVEGCTLPASDQRTLMDHYIDNPHGGFYWTCNIAYRRELLLAVGGFDEGFPLPSGEDIDIAERIRKRGDIRFAPEAVVRHLILKRSFAGHLKTARTFSSMIRLQRKHPGLLIPAGAGFAHMLGFQLKSLLLPIVTQRRAFPKAPRVYVRFAWCQFLMACDTLWRAPCYYREFQAPLDVREPFHAGPTQAVGA